MNPESELASVVNVNLRLESDAQIRLGPGAFLVKSTQYWHLISVIGSFGWFVNVTKF